MFMYVHLYLPGKLITEILHPWWNMGDVPLLLYILLFLYPRFCSVTSYYFIITPDDVFKFTFT